MKKGKFIKHVNKFRDYEGIVRKYMIVGYVTDNEITLGFSVQRKEDEFDESVGYSIALEKIENSGFKINTNFNLFSSDRLVNEIIHKISTNFRKNPGKFIKNYDEDAKKYRELHDLINFTNSLNSKEKDMINELSTKSPEFIDNFVKLLKHCLKK